MSFFVTTELDTIMGQNAYGYFYEIEELAIIARHFRPLAGPGTIRVRQLPSLSAAASRA